MSLTTYLVTAIALLSLIVIIVLFRLSFLSSQLNQARRQYLELEESTSDISHQFELKLEQREQKISQMYDVQLELQNEIGALKQLSRQFDEKKQEFETLKYEHAALQESYASLNAKCESQSATMREIQQHSEEKLKLLADTEARLQTQFENLANKIFDDKSERYLKQNKQGLDAILSPLKEQIDGFKRQVSDQYIKEGQERASLKTEIMSLKALNQKITEEANALTQALKGNNKTQGNWGEVVLERILKQSGLRDGYEYDTQVSNRNDEGKRLQPDVVVHLPDDKDVIIDSKVSLAAYERYYNCDNDADKKRYLAEHVASIKGHIKGLGAKDYHELKALRTLDYVLMFIPIESAFLLAIDEDPELVTLALNNNIMLVSPTNLLVALRTINNIWQYEYQNQNAQKIAANAAKLYDKFVGFIQDLDKLGKSMDSSQKHFQSAFSKLSQGRGNLVRQVEQFRELGVQPSKHLPSELTSIDEDTD